MYSADGRRCGGINDIPLIAGEMGADASMVAVPQFVRLLVGIGLTRENVYKSNFHKNN